MGFCTSAPRLPLVVATDETRAWLREFHDGPLAALLQAEA